MTSHFSLKGQQALAGTESKRITGAFKIILVLLFVANVYDPGGALGVKYGVFFMDCIFSLWTLKYLDLSVGEIVAGLFCQSETTRSNAFHVCVPWISHGGRFLLS